MKKSKPSVKYQGISMPIPFIEEIKKFIMKNSKYRSVADFTREAIREKMHREGSEFAEPRGVEIKHVLINHHQTGDTSFVDFTKEDIIATETKSTDNSKSLLIWYKNDDITGGH